MYFPLFLMKSGRKRSAHSRRQFIQCFLTGAAFRQRPLSRILINVLAGTRKLPPEEPAPKVSVWLKEIGKVYTFTKKRLLQAFCGSLFFAQKTHNLPGFGNTTS